MGIKRRQQQKEQRKRTLNKTAKKSRVAGKAAAVKDKTAKRRFSRGVRYQRGVIKTIKHGTQSSTLLETNKCRYAMQADIADKHARISDEAIALCKAATEKILDEVTHEMTVLLDYAGKRTADEATIRLAIRNVMSHRGYFGNDLMFSPEFVYRGILSAFIPHTGRTTSSLLAAKFEQGQVY